MGDAVKKALHIPNNLAPLMATLTSLTTEGAKFASGEGSSEAAAGVVKQLQVRFGLLCIHTHTHTHTHMHPHR